MKILKTFLFVIFAFFIANIAQVSAATVTGSVTVTVTTVQYTVSTSAGTGGSISPTSALVTSGNTTTFTITVNSGYGISSVTGCGGSLSGTVYTTGQITQACTVTASFNLLAVDSCGSGSGSTPQSSEPTGTSACSKGTLNSSSPSDTSLLWKWSCGTVTSCSAPKYGCTTTDDINYNASGPSNTYNCANKCSVSTDTNYNTAPCSHSCTNGGTSYPTCNPPSSDTITAYDCAIPPGSSGCQTSVSWNIANPVGVTKVTFYIGNVLSTSSSGSGGTYTSRGNITYYLSNNGSSVGSSTATASCTSGTSWDSATGTCKALSALPDITTGTVSTFNWFPIVGTSSDFYAWIDNLGTTAANNFTVLYQKATNVDDSGNATGITDENTKSGVSVGAVGSGSVRSPYGTINFYTAGKNYVRICSDKSSAGDSNGIIVESNENNNCSLWKSVTVLDHPTAPIITGNTTFKKNTYQTFTFTGYSGVYTGGHQVRYAIDWDGDGTINQYTSSFVNSGTTDSASYMNWTTDGDYIIKAATQDVSNGDISSWTSYPIHVGDPAVAPVITSFSADKYSIDFGKAVILTWASTGATSCSITSSTTSVTTSGLSASSNKSFKPTKTTNYTLTCTGTGGSDSETLPNPVVVGKINPNYQEY